MDEMRSDKSLLAEEGLQRLVFMHFLEDIAASHQLSIDVQLRVSRPTAVYFHLFSHYLII